MIYELKLAGTLAFSLAAAPQKESKIKFTYRHWNCSWRLLAVPRFCGLICLWAFYRANFGISCMCRNFKGTPDRWVRKFFLRNYNKVVTLKRNTFFMFLPPNVEQGQCEYTNCNIFERIISVWIWIFLLYFHQSPLDVCSNTVHKDTSVTTDSSFICVVSFLKNL